MKSLGTGQEEAMQERMNKVHTMKRPKDIHKRALNAVSDGKTNDQVHRSSKEGTQV